jgi:hypothetical protein
MSLDNFDAVAAVESLCADDIRQQLDKMECEAKALRILLRAVRARDRTRSQSRSQLENEVTI